MIHAFSEFMFWAAAFCVAYAYVIYPLAIALIAKSRRQPFVTEPFKGSISIVMAAHNEEPYILRRLNELTSLLDASGLDGEIIVVSDGSTDATVAMASAYPNPRVHVEVLSANAGKAAAMTRGCQVARGEIFVFADARQRWSKDALVQMLRNFNRPEVGAVSGHLVLETDAGLMSGVGLYWRYEKWLRRNESGVHSTVGVSGSISAVRRNLFTPMPRGTILDDVYWPLCVAMRGHRVVHDEAAMAFDKLPSEARDEFRRKVRTLSGNFQLVRLMPSLLLPWRNCIWLQFVSHKMLRLVVPWALIVMLICSAFLQTHHRRSAGRTLSRHETRSPGERSTPRSRR